MSTPYVPSPEELGRRRFPDNKAFRKQLYNASLNYLSQIQGLTPSNYPKDPSTNLSIFNRVIARELARLSLSANSINNDKQYTATRVRYLQEILGERLGLGTRIAPTGYNSESYRDYLVSIKNAYLKGSKLSTIEELASKFIGFQVNIKELYLQARDPSSSLDVTSANKMVVQVLVDDLVQMGYNINTLKADLDFFIGLTRPAHVLYDSQLLWLEQIDVNKVYDVLYGDLGGGCVPAYDYLVTDDEPSLLALQVFVLPSSEGATGLIDSIHHHDLVFYFDNSTRVITEPGINGTHFYDVYGRRGNFDTLEIGQYVRMSYLIIPGSFQFWYYPSLILPTWQSMFYRDVFRLPLFQETVKKIMDAQGRFPLQIKTTPTTICDRWVQDALQPMYEDLRQVCAGTNLKDYRVTLNSRMGSPNFSWPYLPSEIYDSSLLGSSYNFWMEHTPLTDGSSGPVTIYDVGVIFDGTTIINSLTTVDASSGGLTITEYPPYWDTIGRHPVPGNEFIFSYHYLQNGINYDATSSKVFGISYWQMPVAPMVAGDGTTTLASIDNVSVLVDGTAISDVITDLDALLGHVSLQSSGDFWRNSELGRIPVFEEGLSTEPLSSGLIAHWKMNDNTSDSTVIDSIGLYNGTWQSGTTASDSTTGKISRALNFDGVNDFVSISDAPSFNSSTFTFCAWLKHSSDNIYWDRVLSKKITYPDADGYEITLDGGNTDVLYVSGSSSSFATIPLGIDWLQLEWHHLVVVYDGPNVIVYCDSTLKTTYDTIAPIVSNTNDLRLGRLTGETTTMWHGAMDDARYYGTALTQAQVNQIYNEGIGTEGEEADHYPTLAIGSGKKFVSGQTAKLLGSDGTSTVSLNGSVVAYNSGTGLLTCYVDETSELNYSRWRVVAGDTFEFQYYSGVKLQYGLLFDDHGRVLDGYFSSQQTYNMLMDGDSIVNHPVILRQDTTAQILVPGVPDTTSNPASPISYRWQLQAPVVGSTTVSIDSTAISGAVLSLDTTSGVLYLQSSDSFWNASVLGQQPTTANSLLILYSYGQVYGDPVENYSIDLNSPEEIGYRYRMYQLHHSSVLNSPDTLLLNGYQKPALRASIINQQPAINHFNKVWSAEFLYDTNPVPELSDDYLDNGLDPVVKLNVGTPTFQQTFSYQPGLIYQRKLQDIRENHRLLMYSDLLLKEFIEGDSDVPLSSICDGDNVGFKVRIQEEIPALEECEPWILFDSVKINSIDMSIPEYYEGVPNLRVEDKLLRNNFILRERESTGVGDATYSVKAFTDTDQTSFQLPASFEYLYGDEWVDFPSLPVVNSSGGYALVSDISVTIDGVPGTVLSLDPITGLVTIQAPSLQQRIEREIIITSEMESAKEIYLHCNSDRSTTTMTIIFGTSQYYASDFIVYGPYLSWLGSSLDGLLSAGDKIRVSYSYDPLLGADVVFNYMIRSHQFINVIDRDWSRIMDDKYVFPGFCADMEDIQTGINYEEYYGMLDDGSDGIKLSFFNHSTLQLEEHIFSGPVFECYDVSTDQIGVPENFYNALIRINNPLSISNPLNYSVNYSFMYDQLVRFRKKTFKELLPNRTFRTMQITEMLPV